MGALRERNGGEMAFTPLQNKYFECQNMLQSPYSEGGDSEEPDVGHERRVRPNVQEPPAVTGLLRTALFQNRHHDGEAQAESYLVKRRNEFCGKF